MNQLLRRTLIAMSVLVSTGCVSNAQEPRANDQQSGQTTHRPGSIAGYGVR